MLRFTLRQLEYFVAVGDTGSIAKASERVNVSSPSISAAITQLEEEFGLPLFVRQHAQGLSLTQAGREMLEQARTVLREASALVDVAGGISGEARGPISIGCFTTLAQVMLPTLRKSFEQAHPDVRVVQVELDQVEIFNALRRSEIDAALTYDLQIPADLNFTPLIELPPFVIVNEDHPLAGRKRVSINDLVTLPMVLLDLPHSADYFLSIFDTRPHVTERTRDMAVMRSLVGSGYGYSIANVRPLNARSPDGQPLQFIEIEEDVRALRLGVVTAQDAAKTHTVGAFLEHTRALVADRALPGIGSARDLG
ncbi:MAG: LysR family transcriptional regulator [Pseudomonadota bacterium]